MKTKTKALAITITRAEGPKALCKTVFLKGEDCWQRATQTLIAWATTAPDDGSYHKCDFTIQYPDGNYDGRYDLSRRLNTDAQTIEAHVMAVLHNHPELFATFFSTHDLNGLNL